jgi:hypothetical protein
MNRWAKAGVLGRLFEELQHQQLVRIHIEARVDKLDVIFMALLCFALAVEALR